MPNLGRLDGDPSLGAGEYSSEATLADLPGLIEGAHLGKVYWVLVLFWNSSSMHLNSSLQGLGRNFLRHLRRTRLLVHVVDAAADDPVNDYRTVKEVCISTSIKLLRSSFVFNSSCTLVACIFINFFAV